MLAIRRTGPVSIESERPAGINDVGRGQKWSQVTGIKLKSLILAQIERWRHALHMQVERQHGATWWRVANG